jgi:hypothetical protein
VIEAELRGDPPPAPSQEASNEGAGRDRPEGGEEGETPPSKRRVGLGAVLKRT